MRRWLPYLIALLIPVMTFISFAFMIKYRKLIFKESFIKNSSSVFIDIKKQFENYYKKNVRKEFTIFESRLEGEINDEAMKKVLSSYNTQLNSSKTITEGVLVSNLNFEILYRSNLTLSNKEFDEMKWQLNNQKIEQPIKFMNLKERYIAYKKFKEHYIFFIINPKFFYALMRENYPYLNEQSLIVKGKNIYMNIEQNYYNKNKDKFIKLNTMVEKYGSLINIPDLNENYAKLKGDYLFIEKVSLKEGGENIRDFIFYLRVDPTKFPMNLWHKMILVINGGFVIIMFIILLFRIKSEMDLEKIKDYGDHGDVDWDENYVTPDIEEINVEDTMDLEIPDVLETTAENDVEEHLEVPEQYYESAGEKETKDNELSGLINEVTDHEEEMQRYNSLWKNISSMINDNELRIMINIYDSENDEYLPHFKKNVYDESPITIKNDHWLVKEYVDQNNALLVPTEVNIIPKIEEIFQIDYYPDVSSFFVAPVKKSGDYQAIIIVAADKPLDENLINDINNLIRMD